MVLIQWEYIVCINNNDGFKMITHLKYIRAFPNIWHLCTRLFPVIIDLNPQWTAPDSKIHGANMGPIWGRQDPGGPHVGPIKSAIWVGPVEAS